MSRVAFIGLGIMGGPMARNLVAAGHEVVGVAARLAAEGHARGIAVLDAPVSGGEAGAIEGTLSIMADGAEDDARAAGVAIPLGGHVAGLVAALEAQGHGRLDHGALLLLVDQLSGRTDPENGDQA